MGCPGIQGIHWQHKKSKGSCTAFYKDLVCADLPLNRDSSLEAVAVVSIFPDLKFIRTFVQDLHSVEKNFNLALK